MTIAMFPPGHPIGAGFFPVYQKPSSHRTDSDVSHFDLDTWIYELDNSPVLTSNKEKVYVSNSRSSVRLNSNAEFLFPDSSEKIVCRHFAMRLARDIYKDPKGKIDARNYSPDNIRSHVKFDNEHFFNTCLNYAKQKKLINNDELGDEIQKMFKKMEREGTTVQAAFLNSDLHAMLLRLRIKVDKDGKKNYVVVFCDPNSTHTWARCEENGKKTADDLTSTKKLTVERFLLPRRNALYFGDSNTSMLVPVDREMVEKLEAGTFDATTAKRTIEADSSITIDTINPIHIYHFMREGLHKNLADLELVLEYFQQNDPLKFKALLFAENKNGTTGLVIAITGGYTQTVEEFGTYFFSLVPVDQRADVLVKAISRCFERSKKTVMNGLLALKILLELVPEDQRGKVLIKATKSVLADALKNGDAELINLHKDLLRLIPENKRAETLKALCQFKLTTALESGKTPSVSALKDLLTLVPVKDRHTVILADSLKGLIGALKNKHVETIDAFAEILQIIPKENITNLCIPADIVDAKLMFHALQNADLRTKQAMKALLAGLGDDVLKKFREAKELI